MTVDAALLAEVVATEVARSGVPGAAVVAVADGEVVLATGSGLRDGTAPVTTQTLFMLASDTKCFAAATLCLLAEDGLLDLDRPVQDHLPWFAMHDDRVSAWVTSRDLLAHRTGLPRHDLLLVGDGDFRVTNEQVARSMRHLEASRSFRQGFGYCNAHYATAGHVVEVLSGMPWPAFLADRLLAPVGMTSTSTYAPGLVDGDFAHPHVAGRRLAPQTREYDLPSGSMVTCADDLGRWLLARLGDGPLSAGVLRTLHAPSVVAPAELPFPELHPLGYALGNLAYAYRGHRLHLHGGSQIGYTSQVMVLPDARVGVAVLTHTHASRLPVALGLSLVDHLLGLEPVPWGERLAGPPAAPAVPPVPSSPAPGRPLQECCGTYTHPAYGDLTVRLVDGGLAPGFHGLDDDLGLTHAGGDDWLLTLGSLPGVAVPVSFAGDTVAVRLEPELGPVPFRRC